MEAEPEFEAGPSDIKYEQHGGHEAVMPARWWLFIGRMLSRPHPKVQARRPEAGLGTRFYLLNVQCVPEAAVEVALRLPVQL